MSNRSAVTVYRAIEQVTVNGCVKFKFIDKSFQKKNYCVIIYK